MFIKKLLDSGTIELKSGHFVSISLENGRISQDSNLDICKQLLYMHHYKKDTNRILELSIKEVVPSKFYEYYIHTKEVKQCVRDSKL